MKKVTFSITNLICCGNQQTLAQKLKLNPHIVDASLNFKKETANITFHEELISEEKIKKIIGDCGFQCQPLPLVSSKDALSIYEHRLQYENKIKK